MIPKKIIEASIAGGWDYPYNDEETFLEVAERASENWKITALDPDFWIALGKEMGWYKISRKGQVIEDDQPGSVYQHWNQRAHRFYDLILRKASQEEITKFWETL